MANIQTLVRVLGSVIFWTNDPLIYPAAPISVDQELVGSVDETISALELFAKHVELEVELRAHCG